MPGATVPGLGAIRLLTTGRYALCIVKPDGGSVLVGDGRVFTSRVGDGGSGGWMSGPPVGMEMRPPDPSSGGWKRTTPESLSGEVGELASEGGCNVERDSLRPTPMERMPSWLGTGALFVAKPRLEGDAGSGLGGGCQEPCEWLMEEMVAYGDNGEVGAPLYWAASRIWARVVASDV